MEKQKRYFNRWIYAIIGMIALILAGLIYAWTVFQAPITAKYKEWSAGSLSLTFTIVMICFCIGGFLAGMLQKRLSPRLILCGASVLMGLGFVISSFATSVGLLYLGFGVLAGFGSGIAYNVVMSCVTKWFPDKQGLISGILLMGFGLGSFFIGKIYTVATPSDGSDKWRTSFLVFAAIVFAVVFIAGLFMTKPADEWQSPSAKNGKKQVVSYEEASTGTMLKRPAFWLYFFWAILLSAAGLMIISQGAPLVHETAPETPMNTVATIVGLISIFNGFGRITFGYIFDRFGRLAEMLGGGILYVAASILILVALKGHSLPLLIVSFIVSGLSYGCVTPANSAFTTLFFGLKNYPVNYSIVIMNLIFASFGSTAAGIIYDRTGSYVTVMTVAIVVVVVSIVLSLLIRKPEGKQDSQL